MAMKRQAKRLLDPWSVLPTGASVFAMVLGCVAANEAVVELLVPAGHARFVALGHYVYILTHLAVGTGSVLGGAVSLVGLWRGSKAALVAGHLSVIASFSGMLVLQMLSLWVPTVSA
jgi:hypothetical protein